MGNGIPEGLPSTTKEGYNFQGWFTEEEEGDKVFNNTEVTKDYAHTLYAHWTTKKVKVNFFKNDGTDETISQTFIYGVEGNRFGGNGQFDNWTREGYTLLGWSEYPTADNKSYDIYNEVTDEWIDSHCNSDESNIDLYAVWERKTYTITFDAQGGNVEPNTKTVINGEIYGELPQPEKTGHTFDGWFTEASGGSKVTSETTVTALANHILYAHWTANPTVTFDANGGTVLPKNIQVIKGGKYGELPTPTKTGHTFNGWFTAVTGGAQVTPATDVTTESDHTLYAHWTVITYTVKYNANGGSGAPESQAKTYGIDLTLSTKKPTRNGYIFKGWATTSNGSTSYQPGGIFTTNANTTLYAVWEQVIAVTSIKLNKTSDQWIPNNGSTLSLTATVYPSNATNKTVTWTSSNKNVATVNSSGKVTAKGAGYTKITATAGGKSAYVNVYVYNAEYKYSYSQNVYKTTDSSGTIKGNIENGDKVILKTVETSWHEIIYSTNSKIKDGYIWIKAGGSEQTKRYNSYGFTWKK